MAELLAPSAGNAAAELAARLIGRFGSLRRALAATLAQWRAAAGGHEASRAAINGARRPVKAAIGEEPVRARVDGADPALHRYLRGLIGTRETESLHVIYCDRARGYLADETVAAGTTSRIVARARPVIERALALGAAGFVLAHNHPSGDCRPSADDVEATRRLGVIAGALELELIDHLIVTHRALFSMRVGGCL